ncbi:MAG: S8 family serine peptidase, partial [Bacteroidota bacterium]
MSLRSCAYNLFLYLLLVLGGKVLARQPQATYHPSKIVVKLGDIPTNARTTGKYISVDELTNLQGIASASKLEKTLPGNVRVKPSKYLSGIHIVDLESETNVIQKVNEISGYDNVIYAEPLFAVELLEIPNDPAAQPGGSQYYLELIKAYEAWEIATGSEDIVIGNVDTGVQLDHSDLSDNLWFNLADPEDGVDNDNNGYVDDYRGWDIANNDNDPSGDKSRHGSQVVGIHSGVGNNEIGMAGVAFDSPYLPVKIFDSEDNRSFNSYGGVMYAADRGVKVMNLSWGSPNSFSQFNQDIINYAALEKDVVIVAAAGNTNEDLDFYPASYDNVISVGSSDGSDNKAGYATYSQFIDLLAPGTGIYSTNNSGGYLSAPGSSFAAPQVAGAAALVRQVFPELTAVQVAEQLRITADDIYGVGSNIDYLGMLGNGRLNIQRALTQTGSIAMQMKEIEIEGSLGDNLFANDTISLGGTLYNYINTATNVALAITSESQYAQVLSDEVFVGQMITGASTTFPLGSFRVFLSENTPKNERIVLRVNYIGNGFTDRQFIVFTANPTYLEINGGEASVTASDNGNLGYEQDVFKNGRGLRYEDILVSNQLGIIIATDTNHVADNAVNNFQADTRDSDFEVEDGLQYLFNSTADDYAEGSFQVSGGQFDMTVEQKVMGWDDVNGLVTEYRLINTSDSSLSNVYLGSMADLNLGFAIENKTAYDDSNLLGYTYDNSESTYVGVTLLSGNMETFRGIDLGDYNDNTPEIDEEVSDSLKFGFLSSGLSKIAAGIESVGNYVGQVMATKFSSVAPNTPQKTAFAYVFGSSLTELQLNASAIKSRYQTFLAQPPLIASYQICEGGDITVVPSSGSNFDYYNDLALTQKVGSGDTLELTNIMSSRTIYAINIDNDYPGDVRSITLEVTPTIADFVLPNDTLIIDEDSRSIQITDASTNAQAWSWDFSNGIFSSQQNPVVNFDNPGIYEIKLTASNGVGCSDDTSQDLIVVARSARPENETIDFCEGEIVSIETDNDSYRLYRNEELTSLVAIGNNFQLEGIISDTLLYLIRGSGTLESLPAEIRIKQIDFPSSIDISHDFTDLSSNTSLLLTAEVNTTTSVQWNIDGNLFSGDTVQYAWNGSPNLTISAEIRDGATGCSVSLTSTLPSTPSPTPVIEDLSVCSNVPIQIDPIGGELFIFYADQNKSQIVAKGNNLELTGLTGDTTFFVTGIDQILESTIVPINIEVEVFTDTILVSPKTLNLSENANLVELSAKSNDAVSWLWRLNGEFFES